jgi:nucleoside phosphorylase
VIDGYSIQARLTPLLISALPLLILGSVALPQLAVSERVVVLGLMVALCPLFDQLARIRGRRSQSRTFEAWGGRPTTQILRWRGSESLVIQTRRHEAIERVTGTRLPTAAEEEADPDTADQAYEAAVRMLRTLTAEIRLVQAENRNYGFRRNLYGLRPWGYLAILIGFLILGLWAWLSPSAMTELPVLGILAGVNLAQLAFLVAVVGEPWMREAAWTYAECLIDQVDRLDAERDQEPMPASAGRAVRAAPDDEQQFPVQPPTVAVVTALACEFAAVMAILRQGRPLTGGPAGDRNLYMAGELPSRHPDTVHQVVTTVLPHDGNRSAAAVVTDVLRSFPTIRCVIFSGIAGGCPCGPWIKTDLKLGDVLVAVDGVVDYDHTYLVDGKESLRRNLQGISADMLRAVQELRAAYLDPSLALKRELDLVTDPRFAMPVSPGGDGRRDGPQVHFGAIGSADRLVRDASRRDQLARSHGILGVEMEASGLAVGASLRGVPWFVVRGVADYSSSLKNDLWHEYASLTSAAFLVVLLRHCLPMDGNHR